jgi:hypothetical protein
LYRWELVAVVCLPLLVGLLGIDTYRRSTHPNGQMTDFGVYARAAWAVRVGANPYEVASDRGWHYLYPPPFVLLVLPLADPPLGADRFGYLPFGVSVMVWFALNVVLCAVTVHLFALAAVPDARRWSRRWWYARLIPFDVCMVGLGYTLSRGQVNVLVLAMLAAGFLAAVRNRAGWAGLWLAAAASIKVLPGLLLLFPAVRRRWRELGAMVAGGVLFLGVVPMLVWGPAGAVEMTLTFAKKVVQPSVTNTGDQTIHKEFSGTTSTDSQAFHAVIHAVRHPDRATRPEVSDGLSKGLHYLIGLGMVAATVWAGRKLKDLTPRPPLHTGEGENDRRPLAPPLRFGEGVGGWGPARSLLFFGCLCVVMVHLAPASHMHYYSYSLPLVAGLMADDLRRRPGAAVPRRGVLAGLIGWAVLTTVPVIDTWPLALQLRDFGLAVAANVGLWAWGVVRLGRAAL